MVTTKRRTTLALALALAGCHSEPKDDGAPAVLSLVRPDALQARFRAYEAAREARTDESITIALQFARGFSDVPTNASGVVAIDLQRGRATLDVGGLGSEPAVELWLVDNREGPGACTLVDPNDRLQAVGTLAAVDGRARGELHWDAATLEGFELDRVLVARPGDRPEGRTLLLGGPGAFERLCRRAPKIDAAVELRSLVRRGAELFERETFGGNGRTCTTCHPASNNLTLDPDFIATLPKEDPLFVFERVPALKELENAVLLRERAAILENLDGFERPGVLRGVPHTFALSTSITGPEVPFDNTLNPDLGIFPPAERTGWSGDGAPGSGSLRDFALGAVTQHFPRTLARVPGRDFRVPTDEELDALEVFQLALGRDTDIALATLRFRNPIVALGQELFLRTDTAGGTLTAAKCTLCHVNAGANIDSAFFSGVLGFSVSGNANFGTGVNDLEALPSELFDPDVPRDGGFARVPHDGTLCTPPRGGFGTVTPEGGALPPGLCEEDFNTPPLIEAADTGAFFHSNAVDSLEGAVEFYDDEAFNESAGGQLLAALDSGGIGIELGATEVAAVAHLLRVLNALENLRLSTGMLELALDGPAPAAIRLLRQTDEELGDAMEVLGQANLHPRAGRQLDAARELVDKLIHSGFPHDPARIRRILAVLESVRGDMLLPE